MTYTASNTLKTQPADRAHARVHAAARAPAITLRIYLSLAIAACTLLPAGLSAGTDRSARGKGICFHPGIGAGRPLDKIPIPPLHAFKPPAQAHRAANGLVIFLQEDHELPFIDGTILIRGGSRDVPAAKTGLVSLYGEAWRTSGSATTKSGDVLDTELAEKAASIETAAVRHHVVEWSSLKQDFDTVFGEAVDLLLHPAFKADKLALAQRGLDTASRAATMNPTPSPAASPPARLRQGQPLRPPGRVRHRRAAVTLDDLKAWHDRTVVPNGIIVSVEGDFDSAAMEAKLRKVFEPLAARRRPLSR
jgi:zinc protease